MQFIKMSNGKDGNEILKNAGVTNFGIYLKDLMKGKYKKLNNNQRMIYFVLLDKIKLSSESSLDVYNQKSKNPKKYVEGKKFYDEGTEEIFCKISYSKLSEEAGCSISAVRRGIEVLENIGLVKTKNINEGTENEYKIYYVALPEPETKQTTKIIASKTEPKKPNRKKPMKKDRILKVKKYWKDNPFATRSEVRKQFPNIPKSTFSDYMKKLKTEGFFDELEKIKNRMNEQNKNILEVPNDPELDSLFD